MVILAAVDRTDRAKKVVDEAAKLSEAFDEPLHVIHVMSESDFIDLQVTSTERGDGPVDIEEVRELAAEQADKAAKDLDLPCVAVGRSGSVRREVTRYADEHDVRYIVIGGRQRSPAGKAIFGSITQAILLNANSSVVTVILEE